MSSQSARAHMEPLESRSLFSVSLNAAGWSVVAPSADTRTIYVSSSKGNDNNSGLSSSAPVQSLSKAASLLRNGFADWMLLDRGDKWSGSFPAWTKAGRSAQEPMLIGTYGSGNLPVIDTGAGDGFIANTKNPVSNLIIDGIQFYADQRDPNSPTYKSSTNSATPTGLMLIGPSNNVLIEDCSFKFFKDNVVLEGAIGAVTNITIRRSIVADSYCVGNRSQGFYADNVNGVTLQENVFDHNGWNQQVSGAGDNVFNHNIYYSYSAAHMVVIGNIIAEASNVGVLARGGGNIDNNLFLQNAVGISYGNASGATSTAGGVSGEILGNVFLGDKAVGSTPMGIGIDLGNIKPGAGLYVIANIFSGDTQQAYAAINLDYASGTTNPGSTVGINDVTIQSNITWGWRHGLGIAGGVVDGGSGLTGLHNLTVRNNSFHGSPNTLVSHANPYNASQEHWSGNEYYTTSLPQSNWFSIQNAATSFSTWKTLIDHTAVAQPAGFVDPTRSMSSYNATLGGAASLAAFLGRADQQSTTNWSLNYTAAGAISYIDKGFTAGTVSTPPPPPPTAASITGMVFNDANSNQKQDSTEAGLAGWTVYLDLNNNGIDDPGEATLITDSSGKYKFAGLLAGTYIVRAIRPAGWNQTTPANGFGQHITVASGQQSSGVLFGEKKIA